MGGEAKVTWKLASGFLNRSLPFFRSERFAIVCGQAPLSIYSENKMLAQASLAQRALPRLASRSARVIRYVSCLPHFLCTLMCGLMATQVCCIKPVSDGWKTWLCQTVFGQVHIRVGT